MTAKTALHRSIVCASIAGVATYLCAGWGIPAWIVFITWAGYFLLIGAPAFSDPVDSFITYSMSLMVGVVGGMAMAASGPLMAKLSGETLAMPLVIFLAVLGYNQIGRIQRIGQVPVHFISASIYFGSQYELNFKGFRQTSVACLFGSVAGLATVLLTAKFLALSGNRAATVAAVAGPKPE